MRHFFHLNSAYISSSGNDVLNVALQIANVMHVDSARMTQSCRMISFLQPAESQIYPCMPVTSSAIVSLARAKLVLTYGASWTAIFVSLSIAPLLNVSPHFCSSCDLKTPAEVQLSCISLQSPPRTGLSHLREPSGCSLIR